MTRRKKQDKQKKKIKCRKQKTVKKDTTQCRQAALTISLLRAKGKNKSYGVSTIQKSNGGNSEKLRRVESPQERDREASSDWRGKSGGFCLYNRVCVLSQTKFISVRSFFFTYFSTMSFRRRSCVRCSFPLKSGECSAARSAFITAQT